MSMQIFFSMFFFLMRTFNHVAQTKRLFNPSRYSLYFYISNYWIVDLIEIQIFWADAVNVKSPYHAHSTYLFIIFFFFKYILCFFLYYFFFRCFFHLIFRFLHPSIPTVFPRFYFLLFFIIRNNYNKYIKIYS